MTDCKQGNKGKLDEETYHLFRNPPEKLSQVHGKQSLWLTQHKVLIENVKVERRCAISSKRKNNNNVIDLLETQQLLTIPLQNKTASVLWNPSL